ncbi:MAG: hypothetical protein QXD77_03325, partial [Candidatus Aenigmatarchaeota archaeon]
AVYDNAGNQVTAPFTVETQQDTTYRLLDVAGKNGVSGNSLCPGTFVVAYTNASDIGNFKRFYVDGTEWNGVCADDPPQWSSMSQNTSTPYEGDAVLLSAYWADDKGLGTAILSTNETGAWQNKTTYGSPMSLSGKTAWSNFTWQNASVTAGTTVGWRIYANDSRNQWNVTDIAAFTVQAAPDTAKPQWSNNKTYPASPATYSPSQAYQFNITWTDNKAVDKVFLEFNGTNYTVSTKQGNEYYYSFTDLPAGSYNYKWYANDTSNNWNSSTQLTYAINRAASTLSVAFSPAATNTYGTTTTAYCNITAGDRTATITIYRNGTSAASGSGNQTDTALLGAGVYNYTCTYAQSENYSASTNANNYLTINKADNPVALYLEGKSNQNDTITYGTQSNATGTAFAGTALLWRDGASAGNPEINVLAANTAGYAYKVNTSGNANYSANNTGLTYYLIVNRAASSVEVTFAPSDSVSYGTQTTAKCGIAAGDAGATLTLFRNGTQAASGSGNQSDTNTLGAGAYNYTCAYGQSQNYSASASADNYLTVSKASTTTRLFLNGTEGNRNYDVMGTANFTVSVNVSGAAVYLDSNISGWAQQSGTTPLTNITALTQLGNFSVTGSYLGNANYSASNTTYYANVADNILPSVMALSPANNSVDADGNVYFNCSATDNYNLTNISLYFNGAPNQTKAVSGTSGHAEFTLSNLADASYTWHCAAGDTSNSNTTGAYNLYVDAAAVPSSSGVSGQTTNWSALPDLSNACNAKVDVPSNGLINWLGCVDVRNQDFDTNVIINQNLIDVKFGLNPSFNSTAQITIRNLSWSDTEDFDLLMNGQPCTEEVCMNQSYDSGTGVLTFNVTHFTNFSTRGTSTLVVWDQNDTAMPGGGRTACAGDPIKFYANY